MIKHAFLILAHSQLDQLDKIIDLLSGTGHYFFINIDKKNSDAIEFMQHYESRDEVFSSREMNVWR